MKTNKISKNIQVFGFVLIWLSSLCFANEKSGGLLLEDKEVRFEKSIWLKIVSPCTIDSQGSKLTVYPYGQKLSDFLESVSWKHGVPRYLNQMDKSSISFDFDLVDRLTVKKKMILRIDRTTMIHTTEGLIVVAKGGRMPLILGSGDATFDLESQKLPGE